MRLPLGWTLSRSWEVETLPSPTSLLQQFALPRRGAPFSTQITFWFLTISLSYPVSEITGYSWKRSEKLIQNASPNGNEMLLDGRAPRPGELFKNPNLAKTFRTLAAEGKAGYYKGRIAEAIVELIQSKGGVMELEDLAKHDTDFVEPISYTFNDEVTVYECPPNGQGIGHTGCVSKFLTDAYSRSHRPHRPWDPG